MTTLANVNLLVELRYIYNIPKIIVIIIIIMIILESIQRALLSDGLIKLELTLKNVMIKWCNKCE